MTETAATENLSVRLTLPQKTLVLGQTRETKLTISVAAKSGKDPVEGCQVQMGTNTGSFSPIQQKAPGEFELTYILPSEFFPQYAIISATANCKQGVGSNWIVVPLNGTGDVQVKSKPKSEIKLRVGDASFGPVTTDPQGKALIPIVAAPGIRYGRVGRQKIDLNLPPVNRLAVSTSSRTVTAIKGQAQIYIYVIDKDGAPAKTAKLIVTASEGTVDNVTALRKGVYQAIYQPPASPDVKKDVVTVKLRKSPSSHAEVVFIISAEAPGEILISSSRESFQAGEKSPVVLDVKVRDGEGKPTSAAVNLKASLGQTDPLRLIETGWYRTQLILPSYFEGQKAVTVRATAAQNESSTTKIEQVHAIKLLPSPPTQIGVSRLSRRSFQFDGRSHPSLKASLRDQFGNPVTDVALSASAEHGKMTAKVNNAGDAYDLIYESPPPPLFNHFAEKDSIRVEAESTGGPLKTRHEMTLKPREYLMAAEFDLGYLTNFGNLHSLLITLRYELNLWFLLPGLYTSLELGYFFDKAKSEARSVSSFLTGLPLIASLGYRVRVQKIVALFAQMGAGAQFIWYEINPPENPLIKRRSTLATIRPECGAALRAGPGEAIIALSYRWVQSVSLPELQGSLGGLGITLGYRYPF